MATLFGSVVLKCGLMFAMLVAVAVLGIGLVAMGEDIGSEMSLRTFGHLVNKWQPLKCR